MPVERIGKWIFVGLISLGFASNAVADTLWTQGGEVLHGLVQQRSENEIVFQEWRDGNLVEQTINRKEIVALVVNVDRARLSRLHPSDLKPYREYGEELLSQKNDPVARQLALRLFLIVAYHDRSREGLLKQIALKTLPDLARTPEEQEGLRKLAAVYGNSEEDTSDSVADEATQYENQQQGRTELLACVRAIRRGELADARDLINRPALQEEALRSASLVSIDELAQMLRLNRLSPDQLMRLLKLERTLQDPNLEIIHQASRNWSKQAKLPAGSASPIPDFRNVTDLDPERSVFREGTWVRPGQ